MSGLASVIAIQVWFKCAECGAVEDHKYETPEDIAKIRTLDWDSCLCLECAYRLYDAAMVGATAEER